MNTFKLSLGIFFGAVVLQGAALAADLGVSVNVSQPGFYGRIDIGRVPQPGLIYPQALIIEQRPMTHMREPIYLRVPPGHEKHWDKHCHAYGACGQPVYFVQDRWYREVYAPRQFNGPQRFDEERGQRHEHGHHGHHGRPMDRRGND
jgi:hypothetical protein